MKKTTKPDLPVHDVEYSGCYLTKDGQVIDTTDLTASQACAVLGVPLLKPRTSQEDLFGDFSETTTIRRQKMKEWVTTKTFAARKIHITAISADSGVVVMDDQSRVIVTRQTAIALCNAISQEQQRKDCAPESRQRSLSPRK